MLRLRPFSTHVESEENIKTFLTEIPEYFVLQNILQSEKPEQHLKKIPVEYAVQKKPTYNPETALF